MISVTEEVMRLELKSFVFKIKGFERRKEKKIIVDSENCEFLKKGV